MTKNLISRPILDCFSQLRATRIFFVGFTSTRCQTLCSFKENLRSKPRRMAKKHIWELIQVRQTQIRAANFFFFFSRIWFRQSQHIVVSHHHVHYQKNRRCTFLFMLNKSRKRDCIGRYTTYVERPIVLILLHNYVETYVYVYLYIYIIDQK